MSDKQIFTRPISGNKNTFLFGLMNTIKPVKQNFIRSMIRKLRVLDLEASSTGTKKKKNILNFLNFGKATCYSKSNYNFSC